MTTRKRYLPLLRSLAYDAALFERCIRLIVRIVESGNGEDDSDEGRRIFTSLFPIHFSGTHATIEQRLAVIRRLTLSEDPKKRTLGLAALRAALEATHFGPGWDFAFGARSRDFGYWPKNRDEVKRWFGQSLGLAEELACSHKPVAARVREILAAQFRGLWGPAAMYDELERIFRRISAREFWPEGWIAVRQTAHYDSSTLTPEAATRLAALEADLRPKGLVQKVRSIVLPEALLFVGTDSTVDDSTDPQKSMTQVETMARELGRAVAMDREALAALLPELVVGNTGQLWSFGAGLAEGAGEARAMWNQLVAQLAATPRNTQNVQVIRGFLNALNAKEPALAGVFLDEAVEDEALGFWYPLLQTAVGLDKSGVGRLVRSLKEGKAETRIYRNLVAGGVTHQVSGADFNNLLMRIAAEPDGLDVAIEILCMRLAFDEGRKNSSPSELVDVGCELMRRITFTRRNAPDDYRLGTVAKHCLVGEKGAATAQEICRNLRAAVSKSETYAFYHADLLQILFSVQPLAALEGLCGGNQSDLDLGVSILDQAAQLRRNPFDAIPEDALLTWCDQLPEIRYPATAAGVTAFQWSGEAGHPQWSGIARKLLDRAPDRVAVLKEFVRKFSPTAWTGSRAVIVQANTGLLDELAAYADPALAEFIAKEKVRLSQVVEEERTMQLLIDRERDERFE